MASTFLTAGDEEAAFQPSAVDQQRLEDREWKAKYDKASELHEEQRKVLLDRLAAAEKRAMFEAARADAAALEFSKTQAELARLSAEAVERTTANKLKVAQVLAEIVWPH